MASTAADLHESLYREMRISQGGVMLLVRLHADLANQPPEVLERLIAIATVPEPSTVLPPSTRLAVTFNWLERQFGRANAVRAVVETAAEILETSVSS